MHTYNLAIIFGPTVIRSQNNDMLSLVADMSNQYKVVECLITKVSFRIIWENCDLKFDISLYVISIS